MAAQGTKKSAKLSEIAGVPVAPKQKKPREFDYTRYRITINSAEDFRRYLDAYPDKTGLMLYVYRLVPKIDLSLVGRRENTILKTATLGEMTPEFIGDKFGRGAYFIKLNDANRPPGQQEVCKTWFRLEDHDKASVYDIRTLLLSNADNIDEINRQIAAGLLMRGADGAPRIKVDSDGAGAPAAGGGGDPAAGGASAGGGDLFTRETMSAVLLKLIDRGSQNPGDTVRQSIEIAKMLTPPAPPPAPLDLEQVVERVVTRLRAAGSGDAFGDSLLAYERVEKFITRVRGGGAVGGDGAAPVAGDGAAAWVAHLPGILSQARGLIPEIVTAFSELRGTQAGPRRAAAPPTQIKTMQQAVEEVSALAFQRMSEGVQGYDFAAWLCTYHPGGLEVYGFLEPGGVDGVISLAAMNPVSRPLVNDPGARRQLETFLSDFFSFDPSGAEPEEAGTAAAPSGASAAGGA